MIWRSGWHGVAPEIAPVRQESRKFVLLIEAEFITLFFTESMQLTLYGNCIEIEYGERSHLYSQALAWIEHQSSRPLDPPESEGTMHLKFSRDIKTLLEKLADQPLTLKDILAETSERGFSLVIGLLVLPFLLPMPPGLTGILGTGCLILSVQMALGRRSPWLPRRIAHYRFPRRFVLQVLKNVQRSTRLLERIARPRWTRLATSPHIWQLNGLCISWLALLLISPIPFTNPIPTIGILLFVIATLETDGLLMCIGYGLTILITLLFGLAILLIWESPALLQQWLNSIAA